MLQTIQGRVFSEGAEALQAAATQPQRAGMCSCMCIYIYVHIYISKYPYIHMVHMVRLVHLVDMDHMVGGHLLT